MLWDPLHYLESCPSSDGAAAMVIGVGEGGRRGSATGSRRHGSTAWPCARSPPCSRDATRSTPRQGATAAADAVPAGRHHRAPGASSTWPRYTSPSAGSSRCGWRTSGSAAEGEGWKLTEPGDDHDRAGTSRGTARAACCRRTPSAPRACCASSRWPCRCGAMAGEHQVQTPARALGHAYGGGSQFFAMWVSAPTSPDRTSGPCRADARSVPTTT